MAQFVRYPTQVRFPPNLTTLVKPTAPKAMAGILDLAIKTANLPTTFDSRDQWTYKDSSGAKTPLIGPILNQGQCGSCYIFSSTEVLADRLSMALGQPIGTLSQQYVLDCLKDSQSGGCQQGGIPEHVLGWLSNTYIPLSTQVPYTAQDGPSCPNLEANKPKWMGNGVYTVSNGDESENDAILGIKKEIYANGPVSCAVTVYSDFMTWWASAAAKAGGVYTPSGAMNQNTVDGGHALKILGWDDTKKAWLIANSWGDLQTEPSTAGGIGGSGYYYQAYNDSSQNAPTGVNKQVVAICVNGDSAKQQLAANGSKGGSYPKPYTCTLVERNKPVPAELQAILDLAKENYSHEAYHLGGEERSTQGCSLLPSTTQGWILVGVIVLIIVLIFSSRKRRY